MDISVLTSRLISHIENLKGTEKIEALNDIKCKLHDISPFKNEPVDCVLWVSSGEIEANDYNPNVVAPPEMKLLCLSVMEDGYTQPIVAHKEDTGYEVVDGFHRYRVGKEDKEISKRVKGYLPVTFLKKDRTNKPDRMAATIRHNRARGKHQVGRMSDIVQELARRNWSNKKIGKHLGMDADEVLRLKQITGLAEMFKDEEFSKAWEYVEPDEKL